MSIFNLEVNECRSALLIASMDISCFMVLAEQFEEQKHKQVGRDLKKVRTEYGNSSNAKYEVKDKPRFKKRFPYKGSSKDPMVNKSKVPNP